jgi:competence protein ComEA
MRRGAWLLVAAAMSIFFVYCVRGRVMRPAPDFLLGTNQGVRLVELGRGFCPGGVHQIFDGAEELSAKELTTCDPSYQGLLSALDVAGLRNGEHIEIIERNGIPVRVDRSWMPAARRINLGIQLHPDQMTLADWKDLPGVGAMTAARIIAERQKNGDFLEFEALSRVSGLGNRRISQMRKYFVPD